MTKPDDHAGGLTKREYFAVMAMQGILAGAREYTPFTNVAKDSVSMADALIDELNKTETK